MTNKIVTLMIGTNSKNGTNISNGDFPILSWWSDNLETVAHYYDGCVIEISIILNDTIMPYVRSISDLRELLIAPKAYTYGIAAVKYPVGAIWYSFSKKYLSEHIIECHKIYPDLSMFDD